MTRILEPTYDLSMKLDLTTHIGDSHIHVTTNAILLKYWKIVIDPLGDHPEEKEVISAINGFVRLDTPLEFVHQKNSFVIRGLSFYQWEIWE